MEQKYFLKVSIEKQYFLRTVIILSSVILLGIITMTVISENLIQNEISMIDKIYSNSIQNEIANDLTMEDFKQSSNNKDRFSHIFNDVHSDNFLGGTIWNMDGNVLFSSNKQKSTAIIESTIIKKIRSGENSGILKKVDSGEINLNQSKKELEYFAGLYLNGNLVGVLEYDINPTLVLQTVQNSMNIIYTITTISILSISGIVVLDYVISRKKLLKGLIESQEKIVQTELDLKNVRWVFNESAIISITDYKGNIIFVNKKFEEISKYSAKELIGQNHRILQSGHHDAEFFKKMWAIISEGYIWEGEIKNRAKDGSFYWVSSVITSIRGKTKAETKYISIRFDITKQKLAEEKLAIALEKLKGDDKLKEEFASMVSHELKSPLTPVTGYCDMLLEPNLLGSLNSEQIESVNIIKNNTKRLEKLIGDVLDAQKLDLNQMKFAKNDFSISTFFATVKNDLSTFMKTKNIVLSIHFDSDDTIKGDETRLRQVIDNLVKNAVDFVPQDDGKIWIGVKKDDDVFLFYVRDNGIGISLENQKNMFKKFFQVNTSMTRKHGGTGLGLVVCKGIVENMGGKIWVESDLGKGTIFYFTLPRTIITPIGYLIKKNLQE